MLLLVEFVEDSSCIDENKNVVFVSMLLLVKFVEDSSSIDKHIK